ncbi:MAG: ATP-binding domain-containing protein [Planctomycetes bacterium]|nr:ATP-binding domain-containing protein [Planctomycetota bacterium]
MAHIFPEEYRDDPEAPNEAERLLYRELAAQLPAEYTVYHRRPWHAPTPSGSAPDGTASFVIAHETHGILVLEAESGRVQRDAGSGEWHVAPAAAGAGAGAPRAIEDPVQAAIRRKRSLAARLRELPAGAARAWPVGHAVAFPQAAPESDAAALGIAREIALLPADLPRLAAWVASALAHWSARSAAGGEPPAPPGRAGIELLSALLGVGLELRRPALGAELSRQELELARLTAEQFRVLDGLARYRRALICGCAGSGKTLLALEKVRRLAEQGLRPLYLSYNVQLRESCRQYLKAWPNAVADNFHDLCTRMAARAGLRVTGPREDPSVSARDFFDRVLPAALAEAATRLPGERFDAIVVDEGQDSRPSWWDPLQGMLRDRKSGILYVFYDDNQCLFTEELLFPPMDARYDLTENCRNVRTIHDLILKYYRSDRRITSRAPLGRPPDIYIYRSPAQLIDGAERAVRRLTQEGGIAPGQIALLTGHGKERSAIWNHKKFGGLELTMSATPAAGQLFWSTVHAFKGLERAAVILAEIDPITKAELETLLYVGCSRARLHLSVLIAEGAATLSGLDDRRGRR